MPVSLSSEIGHIQSHDEASASTTVGYRNQYNAYSSVSEIEEESSSTSEIIEVNDHGLVRMETIKEESFEAGSLYSLDLQSLEDSVYVGVGKSESSMEALVWTIKHAVTSPSTVVYLVHVFPEILYIPSPCKLSHSLSLSPSFSLWLVSHGQIFGALESVPLKARVFTHPPLPNGFFFFPKQRQKELTKS